jgi:hypothetical protein
LQSSILQRYALDSAAGTRTGLCCVLGHLSAVVAAQDGRWSAGTWRLFGLCISLRAAQAHADAGAQLTDECAGQVRPWACWQVIGLGLSASKQQPNLCLVLAQQPARLLHSHVACSHAVCSPAALCSACERVRAWQGLAAAGPKPTHTHQHLCRRPAACCCCCLPTLSRADEPRPPYGP